MSTNETSKTKFIFSENETVLCYHGPLLYEAKCLKAEERENGSQYLIHYSGWNKSWDEWVPTPRVLKYNEESLKKQKDLLAAHGGRVPNRLGKNPRRSTQPINLSDEKLDKSVDLNKAKAEEPRDTRRRRTRYEEVKDSNDSYTVKIEVCVTIPNELKQQLVDDYNTVKNLNKLVTLPCAKTVETILDDYLEYKLDKQCDKSIITELVSGVKDYFNAALPTKLLYKFERIQHNDTMNHHQNKKFSEVYGAIHLLRLFAKFGELLSYTYWDEFAMKQLQFNLEDILSYILENRVKLFTSKDYYSPSVQYVKISSS